MNTPQIDGKHFCGSDLHDKSTYLYIKDKPGNILMYKNIKNNFEIFLRAVEPYRDGLVVGVESTHNYYWLLDGCRREGIDFYLGHAYYLRSIRGKKTKNDKIDAKVLADLLRTSLFPIGYPYPEKRRATRDLNRKRIRTVRIKGGYYNNTHLIFSQQGMADAAKGKLKSAANREELESMIEDEDVRFLIKRNSKTIEFFEKEVKLMDKAILKKAIKEDPEDFRILTSFPGIGNILALTILYETDSMSRFETHQKFSSYSRVVKPQRESSGKRTDNMNSKIGNPYLKWAFSQATVMAIRNSPGIKKLYNNLLQKCGKKKAYATLRHKIAVAVFYMLVRRQEFNEQQFLGNLMRKDEAAIPAMALDKANQTP
jgi:transposase